MNWVIFNGAMVYLDQRTQSRITELGGIVKSPKRDHIPMFTPKAATFGLDEVNACAYKVEVKDGMYKKMVEKANWKKLEIS